MPNFFSYEIKNQFDSSKETEILVSYCGRQIGIAFTYMDDVHIEFTEKQPMIPMNEWKFLSTILNKIKSNLPVS